MKKIITRRTAVRKVNAGVMQIVSTISSNGKRYAVLQDNSKQIVQHVELSDAEADQIAWAIDAAHESQPDGARVVLASWPRKAA